MSEMMKRLYNNAFAVMVGGAAMLIAAALFFQYVLLYAPCVLCHYQRWPYYLLIGVGIPVMVMGWQRSRTAIAVATGLVAIDAGIAAFHGGVERKWWSGPTGCTGFDLSGDLDALLDTLSAAPVVACDDISWSLFGLSMANWNMIFALALTVFGIMALREASKSSE